MLLFKTAFIVHTICLTLIQEMTSVTLPQMVHQYFASFKTHEEKECFFFYKGHTSIDYLK